MNYTEELQEAKDGDADAQWSLGMMYLIGRGVEKDYKAAIKWYAKAADQGHARAQCRLARAYRFGLGVDRDCEKAIYWYTKSAEQGDVGSLGDLEFMYRYAQDIAQDDKTAVEWQRRWGEQVAKEQKSNIFDCRLDFKLNSKQDERNHKETVKLFKKVIEQESEKALLDKEFKEEQDKAAAKNMLLKLVPVFSDELFRGFDLSCDQVKDIAKRFHECNEIKGWLLFELKRARGEIEL